MVKEKLKLLQSGKLSAEQNVKDCLKVIKSNNKKFNVFLYVAEKEALAAAKEIDKKKKKGKLAGLTIGIKAVINVQGMPVSCASKVLEDYRGTYDADVVRRIKEEDGIVIGMVNCDEFASGASGQHSAFGATVNPAAPDRVAGGSSSGPAAAIAAGMCDLTLGTDTGGSIRNPASHCGVVGIKASYGRVSRYGLCDLSMSLDTIGPMAGDVFGTALLMEVIAGKSGNDPSTYDEKTAEYTQSKLPKQLTIGLSKDFEKLCTNKHIYTLVQKTADQLANTYKAKIKNVSLTYKDLGVQTYYPIVYTEFYSATRKLDGRRFGKKFEEAAGEEALRRMLGGKEISKAEHHGAYYRTALKAKGLIRKDFDRIFKDVDVVLLPVTPVLPNKLDEKLSVEDEYAIDVFTTLASLAGICGASVPIGKVEGVPIGIQILAPAFKEDVLVSVMKAVEELKKE